jgi:hypothetical protein
MLQVSQVCLSLFFTSALLVGGVGIATSPAADPCETQQKLGEVGIEITCPVNSTCTPSSSLCDYTSTAPLEPGGFWEHRCKCDNGGDGTSGCNGTLSSTSGDPSDPGCPLLWYFRLQSTIALRLVERPTKPRLTRRGSANARPWWWHDAQDVLRLRDNHVS